MGTATVTCGSTGWSVTAADCTRDKSSIDSNPITFSANTTSVSRGEIVNFTYAVSGNPNSCKVWYSTTSENI